MPVGAPNTPLCTSWSNPDLPSSAAVAARVPTRLSLPGPCDAYWSTLTSTNRPSHQPQQ